MRMYELAGLPNGQESLVHKVKRSAMAKILKSLAIVSLLVVAGAGNPLAATDGAKVAAGVANGKDPALFEDVTPQLRFSSPLEAYRQGKTAFDEGWYELALPALRFAAKRGVFGARLKLANMCELGLGMPRDPAVAYDLYKNIAEKNWNISSFHPAAPYIGQALASLGVYYLNGIEEIGLKPNVRRAAIYFTHASQFFGNPRAQYQLAKLYLSGRGLKKNTKRAVGWLKNATKKRYAPAQALLAQILWEGTLVPKRQIEALALLTMAQENAGPQDSEWINELHKTIVAAADLKTQSGARTAVARWMKIYRPRIRIKGVILRKRVIRPGIAERTVQTRKVGVRRKTPKIDNEQRQWIGLGSFREID